MGEGGFKIHDQNAIYYLTFTVVEWIDVFTRAVYRDIVVDSLKFCQEKKGLSIYAWVIMSNHLHLIASANESYKLSNCIRDFKSFTSTQIIKEINNSETESRKRWMLKLFKEAGLNNSRNTTNQFWIQESHPIELNTNFLIDQKINYIHQNPVKAELVDRPEDYVYSSARDYFRISGLIKVEILD